MPFVTRDANGNVCGVLRDSAAGAEFMGAEHPELRAFFSSMTTTDDAFEKLDADFVRVLEDVIETLISRNLIAITDLPDRAQAKLFARKSFRDQGGRGPLQLFEHDKGGGVI